jgi:hypothetical protein
MSSDVLIRGLTLTRPSITIPPNTAVNRSGIGSDGARSDIDSCIIENCVAVSGSSGGGEVPGGAAIQGIHGTIRNCIIRNNRSDGAVVDALFGAVQNNVFSNNFGGALTTSGDVINNTIYNSGGMSFAGISKVLNNIFWNDQDPIVYSGPPPRNCLIKGYTGPGENIITSDPKFVDPDNGDFRLRADSPCIDAGLTTDSVKADIKGVQRGLQGTAEPRGDGGKTDIGAHEFIPKPVAVWLPGGGPDTINAGDDLAVAWESEIETAGTAVALRLQRRGVTLFEFGPFFSATGAGETTLPLPADLIAAPDYTLQAVSSFNPALSGQSPPLAIHSPYSALPGGDWSMYR